MGRQEALRIERRNGTKKGGKEKRNEYHPGSKQVWILAKGKQTNLKKGARVCK